MPARLTALLAVVLGVSLAAQEKPALEKPKGLESRSKAQREKLLAEHGGNARSERAVADGLRWLALHQAADGHWGLHDFNKHARKKPWPDGEVFTDDSTPQTTRRSDTAATAFGLLPFLAAGISSKEPEAPARESYHRGVEAGLRWLVNRQVKAGAERGSFGGSHGGDMYSHALATLAMCEAYHMTGDPTFKASAQLGLNYIVAAQDPSGGGWRYVPRTPGDLSVTGFQLQALKAGQMAGLTVPRETLQKAEKFLDSVEADKAGGYRYAPAPDSPETPSMTAVGLLGRIYLSRDPRTPARQAGVRRLRKTPPGASGNLYYESYATRVMFHLGGDEWREWNEGPGWRKGMRDLLIARQDKGDKNKANAGSWAGQEPVGGRLGATSFALLTLQVYYRHPPLARKPPADK